MTDNATMAGRQHRQCEPVAEFCRWPGVYFTALEACVFMQSGVWCSPQRQLRLPSGATFTTKPCADAPERTADKHRQCLMPASPPVSTDR
jgi:hypothetical protein